MHPRRRCSRKGIRASLLTAIVTAGLVVNAAPVTEAAVAGNPPVPPIVGPGSSPAPSPSPTPQPPRVRDDARLLQLHNRYRAGRELVRLAPDASLTSFARRRAAEMAAREDVWHSRSLPAGERWAVCGENVGRASTVEEVFDGFLQSASHRANVARPGFRAVGIGVAETAGTKYVAVVYGEPWDVPAPAPPAVAAAPAGPAVFVVAGLPHPAAASSSPVAVQAVTYLVRLVALEG